MKKVLLSVCVSVAACAGYARERSVWGHTSSWASLLQKTKQKKNRYGWADKAMTIETGFELLTATANILKTAGDLEGFKKYIFMAITKAQKYNVPADRYEKMLSAI